MEAVAPEGVVGVEASLLFKRILSEMNKSLINFTLGS